MPFKDIEKHRKYHREYQRKWTKNNREKVNKYAQNYKEKIKDTDKFKKQLSDVRFRRHHRNKIKVLEMYGKKCVYCGNEKYEILSVDHINNNGAEHRKTKEYKKLNVGGMWGYLSATEYRPDLYQILCHNCNMAKYYYGIEPGKNDYQKIEYWKKLSELLRGYDEKNNTNFWDRRLHRPSFLRSNIERN